MQSNGNDIDMADNDKIVVEQAQILKYITMPLTPFLKTRQLIFSLNTGPGTLKIQDTGGNDMATFLMVQLYLRTILTLNSPPSGGVDITGALYASSNIGLDSTDFISFTGNTRMDILSMVQTSFV